MQIGKLCSKKSADYWKPDSVIMGNNSSRAKDANAGIKLSISGSILLDKNDYADKRTASLDNTVKAGGLLV